MPKPGQSFDCSGLLLPRFHFHIANDIQNPYPCAEEHTHMFLISADPAKKKQRSIKAKRPFVALSDIRLCVKINGLAVQSYVSRSLLAAPQESHYLSPWTGHVGAEHGVVGTLGDAVFHRPQYCVVVVAVSSEVFIYTAVPPIRRVRYGFMRSFHRCRSKHGSE